MAQVQRGGTVTFTRVFSAAHRVWNDPGKCQNIHGHNYEVEVAVTANELTAQNFVVPFDVVKRVVDAFDHVLILDEHDPLRPALVEHEPFGIKVVSVRGVPSTEFLAGLIARQVADAVLAETQASSAYAEVTLRETASICAQAAFTAIK